MKKSMLITAVLFLLIVFGATAYYFGDFGLPAFSVVGVCQQVLNPLSGSAFTEELSKIGTYVCKTDASGYCEVWATAVIPEQPDGKVEKWVTQGCTVPGYYKFEFDSKAACEGTREKCHDPTDKSRVSNGRTPCESIRVSVPFDWNLCVMGKPRDYRYCDGIDSIKSGSGTFTVGYVRLENGESLTYRPEYTDGSPVDEYYLKIKVYDCSCLDAAKTDPNVCVSGEKYCISSQKQVVTEFCGTKSEFSSVSNANNVNYKRCSDFCSTPCLVQGDCSFEVYGWSPAKYVCRETKLVYDQYKVCDKRDFYPVGAAKCDTWGTVLNCPVGTECIVKATARPGEGIGACGCAGSPCVTGQKRAVTGDPTRYQICETKTGCPVWGSEAYCTTGLIFSEAQQRCVCDPALACTLGNKQCVGDKIKTCVAKTFAEGQCYYWGDAVDCQGDQKCKNNQCSCSGIDQCDVVGQIKCLNSVSYQECQISSALNSCKKWSGTINVADIVLSYCDSSTNVVKDRADVGCAYGTAGYACDTNIYQECDNVHASPTFNSCVCVKDGGECTYDELISAEGRCKPDGSGIIQMCSKYENIKGDICYRWKDSDTNCGAVDKICVKNSPAQCVPKYQYAGILSKENFGINENIKIVIDVLPSVGDNKNIKVVARVYSNEDPSKVLAQKTTVTGPQGNVSIDFGYARGGQDTLTIEALVGADGEYKIKKNVTVKSTVDITLACPVQGFIERPISCSWVVKDAETQSTLSASPTISVTQGTNPVIYTPSGTTGISFSSPNTGNVKVTVKAAQEGYIEGEDTATIVILGLKREIKLNIDGRSLEEVGSGGITTGTHKISFRIDEEGQDIEVVSVKAEIRTPSGGKTSLQLNNNGGEWYANYNFAQAGHTYTVFVEAEPVDTTKTIPAMSFSIVTIGSGTEEADAISLGIWVAGGALAFVFLVAAVLFLRRK